MDGILVKRVSLGKSISEVLIEVLRDERSDGSHELSGAEKHIEEDSEGNVLVLDS